jgi:hypothetical protein
MERGGACNPPQSYFDPAWWARDGRGGNGAISDGWLWDAAEGRPKGLSADHPPEAAQRT